VFADGTPYSYSEVVPGWEKTLSSGNYINAIVRDLPQEERDLLTLSGILSILVVPIFIKDRFWGFVGFDDCHRERIFTKEEESILHSASLMIANSFIRNEMIQSIHDASSQLEKALKEANIASKAKGDFLAKMSHEIRTPMNAVLGMTELALREDMSITAREHVITAKQAGVNLLSIINDVLDFSKIESGDMGIVPANYYLSSLVNDVISIIRMRTADSEIHFAVNLDCNLPYMLIGDEPRIRQVLINILGNAVKYTEKGYVLLKISGELVDESVINLKMEVSDSGRGIKQEHLEKLFDSYYQANLGLKAGVEGVGLGLAITKSLVMAMDGGITVESEYGKGSTFTVTLPQIFHGFEPLATVKNSAGLSVLVYEHREVYMKSIVYAITNLGVKCELATNNTEFLHKIKNGSYSFVFLSYTLFEECRGAVLRCSDRHRIVLLTEFGQTVPDENWNVLSMPVHAISAANLFNGVSDNFLYSSAVEMTARFVAPKARVLIVDDIKTNLKVAGGLLSPYNMQVDLCEGGAESITAVTEADYDLVFMDHRMPDVDGVEATRRIRLMGEADSRYNDLPIVALTANAVSGMKEMFLKEGFNDFLPKPIDTVKLNAILEKWIPKHKQESAAKSSNNTVADACLLGMDISIDGLNIPKGVKMSGGNDALYCETLAIFCEDGLERISMIRECLEKRNLDLYTIYVHALKSALANVGGDRLSKMAYELEMAGQRNDLFYIEANNEMFVADLEDLIFRINAMLPSGNSGSGDGADVSDAEQFKTGLVRLKTALEDMNVSEMDQTADSLTKSARSFEEHSVVKKIKKHILMGEYEEAIGLIDGLTGDDS